MNKKNNFELGTSKLQQMLAAFVFLFGMGHATPTFAKSSKDDKEKSAKEIFVNNEESLAENTAFVNTEKPKATNYDPIKLNTMEDMYKLFDMSLSIIFAEAILEEVPMTTMYDDHGKYSGGKNTIGTGTTYAPIDFSRWNDTTAKWYHLYSNPKTFKNRTVSHEQMLQLVIGWGKYRKYTQNPETKKFIKRKTVLERMFEELKGASLRPNEFAALYMAAYNNEGNIKKLCPFVKAHYKDPVACADTILTWCKSGPANGGTKDRCEFEAMVYLNVDGFCEDMLEMYTKPGSVGCSCINVDGVVAVSLTKQNYKTFSNNARDKYKKVIYPKNKRICTGDIIKKLSKYFKNPLVKTQSSEPSLQKQYDEAIVIYQKGEYQKALDKLLNIEAKGGSGAYLMNDIAISYYALKQYDNCIKYCQKVLKTGEKQEYAKTCYNAGRAYEAKGMYDKAILNYTKAKEYFQTHGVDREDPNVDYVNVYENAIKRATELKTKAAQSVNTNQR